MRRNICNQPFKIWYLIIFIETNFVFQIENIERKLNSLINLVGKFNKNAENN